MCESERFPRTKDGRLKWTDEEAQSLWEEHEKLTSEVSTLKAENESTMEIVEACGVANREFQEREKVFEAEYAELRTEAQRVDDRSHGFELDVVDLRYRNALLEEVADAARKIGGGGEVDGVHMWIFSSMYDELTDALEKLEEG